MLGHETPLSASSSLLGKNSPANIVLVSTHVPTLVPLGLHYLWPRLNNTYQDRVDLDMQMKVSILRWFWQIKVYKHMIFETLVKSNSTSEVTQT